MTEKSSLQEIIHFRKTKLATLREGGIDPYPHKYSPTHQSAEIKGAYDQFAGQSVSVAGRIISLRRMGRASFFHVQDAQGPIQIYVREEDIGRDHYGYFKLYDLGDIVGVQGEVFKTKTEEISIHAREITLLAKNIRPLPVVKRKGSHVFDAFEDKELRYRYRHLDLIVNPHVREVFIRRSKIITALRHYLDRRGFLEVETPVLQPLYGGANARPFTTHHHTLDRKLYLRIADELYLKRLIIGGFDRVYELSKCFRNEGMDRNHNPEFTALEFYQAYADYEAMMDLVEDLVKTVAKEVGTLSLQWGSMHIDLEKPFPRIPILELLAEATGHDLRQADEDQLRQILQERELTVPEQATYGHLLDELMRRLVEPQLIQPTFVIDYPKAVSPLAKTHRSGDETLVERFELFIGGAEFANAFTELNDPFDQRERFQAQAALRQAGDEEAQPIDEDFIQALECGMPPTGGVGMGVDRLVMLLTGQRWIKDVILFPVLRSVPGE